MGRRKNVARAAAYRLMSIGRIPTGADMRINKSESFECSSRWKCIDCKRFFFPPMSRPLTFISWLVFSSQWGNEDRAKLGFSCSKNHTPRWSKWRVNHEASFICYLNIAMKFVLLMIEHWMVLNWLSKIYTCKLESRKKIEWNTSSACEWFFMFRKMLTSRNSI